MTDPASGPETFWFVYQFRFPDGTVREFRIDLNPTTLEMIPVKRDTPLPKWTQLSHCKCPHCPLKEETHPNCPIAANLEEPVDFFKSLVSFEEIELEVRTAARTYRAKTALQFALSSLLGIYMTTSGCPVMDKLRPMVALHLPVSSPRETTLRSVSMYLLAQLFIKRKGREPDWSLKKLEKIYDDIEILNEAFLKRLAEVHIQDAGLNAVFHLDCHAQFTNMFILEESLLNLEHFFQPYLDDPSL